MLSDVTARAGRYITRVFTRSRSRTYLRRSVFYSREDNCTRYNWFATERHGRVSTCSVLRRPHVGISTLRPIILIEGFVIFLIHSGTVCCNRLQPLICNSSFVFMPQFNAIIVSGAFEESLLNKPRIGHTIPLQPDHCRHVHCRENPHSPLFYLLTNGRDVRLDWEQTAVEIRILGQLWVL
jgi:hypothetical protein